MKPLIFEEWLEKQGIKFDDFLKNCKTENQCWVQPHFHYKSIDELKKTRTIFLAYFCF